MSDGGRMRLDPARIGTLASADVVVVGSGVAGLTTALAAAPRRVLLVTAGALGEEGSTAWAQGGIAAALGEDDSAVFHAADTEAAGAGLVDAELALLLAREAGAAIGWLEALGMRFDRDGRGRLALGREAAHRRHRILHAGGDGTGPELARALSAAARRARHLEVLEGLAARALVVDGGHRVRGVVAVAADGRPQLVLGGSVVLATGGLGGAYLRTTNPLTVRGEGLVLAAWAGAVLRDLEFVQFHPTALLAPGTGHGPLPLLTEALRGAGAVIVDRRGERFLPAEHEAAELAPRDVVARALWRRQSHGGAFLDARTAVGEAFPGRFPTVFAACRARGIDPCRELLPVTPAAHYHMGGVATDGWGRTSLPGLWAVGEVAASGVHGANRLASNSLLEGLVLGRRVAADLDRRPGLYAGGGLWAARPGGWDGEPAEGGDLLPVRRLLWERAGLVRDEEGLAAALAEIEEQTADLGGGGSADLVSLLTVARLVVAAARVRRESRGGHYREDYPLPEDRLARHLSLRLAPRGPGLPQLLWGFEPARPLALAGVGA
jgi:L-aspartate oxidase